MAARAKKQGINLLPQEEFAASTFGRILAWAVGALRIIVIITEMVVMVAFLSRFWLDARATDLNDEIEQKSAIISSQKELEKSFRDAQQKLRVVSTLAAGTKIAPLFTSAASTLPVDVTLSSISAAEGKLQVRANSLTEESISQFIVNLESKSEFSTVTLNQVSSKSDSPFISFALDATLNK